MGASTSSEPLAWHERWGIDGPLVLGLASKAWASGATLITVLIVASTFSAAEQGYYYTFGNLLALTVFAEMGLGFVLIQFASHEWAHLRRLPEGSIDGDVRSRERLASLAWFSLRWNAVAAVGVLIFVTAGGAVFLSRAGGAVAWQGPWIAASAFTAGYLLVLPLLAILEGCDQLRSVYGYRLTAGVLSSGVAWVAMLRGAGLWAVAAVPAIQLIVAIAFFSRRWRPFFASLWRSRDGARVDWRYEILPMQWRVSLSWLSGYFSFYLYTPIAFVVGSPALAGQVGMTLSVAGLVVSAASMWVTVKVPTFGALIARREFEALDKLYGRRATTSFAASLLLGLGVIGAAWLAGEQGWPIADRLLNIRLVAIFVAAAVLSQLSFSQASYLRAHKRDPFVGLSVAQGVLTSSLALYLGLQMGATGLALANLLVVGGLVLPAGTYIWAKSRARWHV